jgi:hypothetical protein
MLVVCKNQECKEDTSLYCFVTETGKHVSPRACTCMSYNATKVDRTTRLDDGTHVVTPKGAHKRNNQAKYGKIDPKCPIPDPHEPISKIWMMP